MIRYVSPNSLLLGRTSQSGDVMSCEFTKYPYKRLQVMQSEVTKFWKSWSQLAGPNLFVRSKWHTKKRNVAVGDIVWLCDQNAMRGQFRLGRVVSTNPGCKGVVRNVNIQVVPSYCAPVMRTVDSRRLKANRKWETQLVLRRDVRRLVVLLPFEEQEEAKGVC